MASSRRTLQASSPRNARQAPENVSSGHETMRCLLLLYLAASLILGGSSAYGALSTFVLQLISIGAVAFCISRPLSAERARLRPGARWLMIGACTYIVLQLVPLPPAIWASLPGRSILEAGQELLGREREWRPVSMDPQRTISSALGGMPLLVIALIASRMSVIPFRSAAITILAVACLSMLLGAAQVAGGEQSPLYFYAYTNRGLAVGWFANANHLASFLVISLPLLAAALSETKQIGPAGRIAAFVVFTMASGSVVWLTDSLAGVLLWFASALAGLLLLKPHNGLRSRPLQAASLCAALVFAAGAWQFDALKHLSGSHGGEAGRATIFETSAAAAAFFWPVGSGLGTFEYTYPLFEDPHGVSPLYINHAHNEYMEWLMETGLVGVVLLAAAVLLVARESLAAWRRAGEQQTWRRASSVVILLLMLHSIVDYPIRTPALMTVLALCWVCLHVDPARVRGEKVEHP